MASRPKRKDGDEPKRLNRTVGLSEAIKAALDPAMKKRGFASRDILTHWSSMAPAPYDKVAIPDRLSWPRGDRGAEGATLYLRCAPGHQLALAQTYQMRSDALQAMLVHAADSEHIGPIIIKLTELGYPEDVKALDELTDAERRRFRMWQIAQQTHWDNMHYQFQQGYLALAEGQSRHGR